MWIVIDCKCLRVTYRNFAEVALSGGDHGHHAIWGRPSFLCWFVQLLQIYLGLSRVLPILLAILRMTSQPE